MTWIAVVIVLALFAGSVYAVWVDHEEAQTERRRELDRIVRASEPKPWAPPTLSQKAAKGFQQRRVG